ncbi:hypothetical protein [Streptomyces sp. A475]|uniref:hypothetical protein n=1 Tax=Streptomyces sp. A475 TaxID=3131976 RepID=UPI0030ECAF36
MGRGGAKFRKDCFSSRVLSCIRPHRRTRRPGLPDFGFSAKALKVNDDGWIVGNAELQPDVTTAVVWDPQGRMYGLGAMVDPAQRPRWGARR